MFCEVSPGGGSSRHEFVALSDLASRNKWCFHMGCTVCRSIHFRYAFASLVEGTNPATMDWQTITATAKRGPLPYDPASWRPDQAQTLLDIVATAPVDELLRRVRFPDWLGHLGLVLHFCAHREAKTRTATSALTPQLVEIVPIDSDAHQRLSAILRDPKAALTPRDLDVVARVLRTRS